MPVSHVAKKTNKQINLEKGRKVINKVFFALMQFKKLIIYKKIHDTAEINYYRTLSI